MTKPNVMNPTIIVTKDMHGKVYYQIQYYDVDDRTWHIGYGSYYLNNVQEWFNTELNIVDTDVDIQPVVDTENMAIVSDEFICKKCGIYLKDYIKVVMDEDNDGYIDEQHYDYEPKFCPECGAKVENCIKTPKRDKPLYTMDEIRKMNGVEFKGGGAND